MRRNLSPLLSIPGRREVRAPPRTPFRLPENRPSSIRAGYRQAADEKELKKELKENLLGIIPFSKTLENNRGKFVFDSQLKEEFEQELADVFCHVLLLAKSNAVDIEKAVEKKWFKWSK